MVLPKIFKSSGKKSTHVQTSDDETHNLQPPGGQQQEQQQEERQGSRDDSDNLRASSSSPTKRSSAKRVERDREREVRPRLQPTTTSSTTRSRANNQQHQQHHPKSNSNRSSFQYDTDPNSHPLNLPPEQLRKRLSAMSARSDSQNSMDIDRDGAPSRLSSMVSSSPPPTSPGAHQAPNGPMSPSTYQASNGLNGDGSPIPPPHKTPMQPISPPLPAMPATNDTPTMNNDAESFKTAGNKYFKAKDYAKAIKEYTKGGDYRSLMRSYAMFIIGRFFKRTCADVEYSDSHRSGSEFGHISVQPSSGVDFRPSIPPSVGRCQGSR